MYEEITEGMLGILPVAVAGGMTIGLTKQAMEIPGNISRQRQYQMEDEKEERREKRNLNDSIFGPAPRGIM